MKNIVIAVMVLLSSFSASTQQRGDIVSFDFLQEYSADSFTVELQQFFNVPASFLGIEYDFKVYRVAYYTEDVNADSITIATSLVTIPTNYPCSELGIMVFGHGLCLKDWEVPSNNQPNNAYSIITKGIAANGFIGAAPDYIHMGPFSSPGPQAFIHSRTQATAYIDLMRAVRIYCADNNIALSGQIFLSGYSQGGNATMGSAKMIQEEYAGEFTVTAACAGGGSFDLSGICADSLSSINRTTPERHSLPLVVRSLTFAYEDSLQAWNTGISLQNVLDTIFKSPFKAFLPNLLDRTNTFADISVLDSIPARMLIDSFLFPFQSDPNHFFRRILADNNVYDWTPQMPLVIFHSDVDIENPYENALFTLERFQQNGAPEVSLFTVNGLSHPVAGQPYVLYALGYMREKRVDCVSLNVKEQKFDITQLSIYPNPTASVVNIEASEPCNISILDASLKTIYTEKMVANTSVNVSGFVKGTYLVAAETQNGNKVFKLLILQ